MFFLHVKKTKLWKTNFIFRKISPFVRGKIKSLFILKENLKKLLPFMFLFQVDSKTDRVLQNYHKINRENTEHISRHANIVTKACSTRACFPWQVFLVGEKSDRVERKKWHFSSSRFPCWKTSSASFSTRKLVRVE